MAREKPRCCACGPGFSPTVGGAFIRDLSVREHPLDTKRNIGFRSGDTQFYQRLTPREVLRCFGRPYGLAQPALEERINTLIRDLEMTTFAGRPCCTLPSGWKQRANISRALLHQPEVLLLDEPTAIRAATRGGSGQSTCLKSDAPANHLHHFPHGIRGSMARLADADPRGWLSHRAVSAGFAHSLKSGAGAKILEAVSKIFFGGSRRREEAEIPGKTHVSASLLRRLRIMKPLLVLRRYIAVSGFILVESLLIT